MLKEKHKNDNNNKTLIICFISELNTFKDFINGLKISINIINYTKEI